MDALCKERNKSERSGTFNGVLTVYRQSGRGQDVVLLHGWGQNKDMMRFIEEHLSSCFRVWNLDFPGFGESEQPPTAWSVSDYVTFLEAFIADNGIQKPILNGHSFGCRVAIRYAALHHDVCKMCLTGAAGIRRPLTARQKWKTACYHFGTSILKLLKQDALLEKMRNHSGSGDYRHARGIMRSTLVKVVNDDVRPLLKDVQCPVLLVWGEMDDAVPVSVARIMEAEMPNAALAIFEGDDHFAYWHQAERFNRVLDIFLKEDVA